VTASRIAADLLQWSTLEFGFFELPDDIVGSSSAMPQKRNPFLLEHVIGKAGLIAGTLQGALMAMHAAPFSNAIAVGTEGVGPLWTGLRELKGALTLLRLFVAQARPRPDAMAASVSRGFTTALLLADHLVATRDLDFRTAHTRVGRAVSMAVSQGEHATLGGSPLFSQNGDAMPMPAWVDDPRAAVARLRYGHGPAPDCAPAMLAHLRDEWQQLSRQRVEWTRVWQQAERDLRAAVAQI
jgi:argininosuccinate lyase